MKSKRLFSAIGNIDDQFINEDAEVITASKDRRSERPMFAPWLKLAMPVAACLVIAIVVFVGQNGLFAPSEQTEQTGRATAETPSTDTAQLSAININELSEIPAARLAIDLRAEDFVPMSKDEIIDFYGFDFFPSVIPADMKIVEEGAYGIYKRDVAGEVYYSENLAWYVDDNVNRQLQVNIDKGKLPHSCFAYLGAEYEKSLINGTELMIGRKDEHFVAEMMYAGNGLRIESSNLTQAEFVDTVTSLIQGLD